MNDESQGSDATSQTGRLWRPLNMRQRRVAGVLVEKAKTTPDAYPMTLNGITTASNQKSNRSPQMNLDSDDVMLVLDELRDLGAVVEVQGGGRVAKYKHLFYEWLDVDKVELAVMAELLLRGEQTLGELRSRAARMEPIADMGALRPVVDSLLSKGLMVELTPAGRGQMVSHNLYEEPELKRLRDTYAGGQAPPRASRSSTADSDAGAAVAGSVEQELRGLIQELQTEVGQLRERLERLEG